MASSRKESSGGEGRLITYGGSNRTRVCTMTGKRVALQGNKLLARNAENPMIVPVQTASL